MKEYRICHISTVHAQDDIRIFQKECTSLAEYGYTVFWVSEGLSWEKRNVKHIGLGEAPKRRIQRIVSFDRKAYSVAKRLNADLYHIHDPELLPVAKGLARKGHKVIFDSHEFTAVQLKNNVRTYIPRFLQRIVGILYAKYEISVTKTIDGLIVPCTYGGKDYFRGNYKRIAYVNNVPIVKLNNESNITKLENSVCYVGTISKARGIYNMVKGVYNAGATLHLIGNVSDDVKNQLAQMEESECIEYYGKISPDKVVPIIAKCKIGISLLENVGQYTYLDNLPTKVYEYMSVGIPVIASDTPYIKSIISGEKCGICVDPQNVDEITQAIKFLLDNESISDEYGRNGQLLSRNKFNWDTEKMNLIKLYEEILSE